MGSVSVWKPINRHLYKGVNKPKYLVLHDTGNLSKGANAEMHRRYFSTTARQASAHFVVDDKEIIQLISVKDGAWHLREEDSKYGIHNKNSIGIELCINSDINREKALHNVELIIRELMEQLNIPAENIVRHYDATRKICPGTMKANGWKEFFDFKARFEDKPKEEIPVVSEGVCSIVKGLENQIATLKSDKVALENEIKRLKEVIANAREILK